ncbi:MAG: hypothetical protein KGD58_03950 [Candidatus Lokiarchaeota archaeon]|nr:hypothetical protein [Candidatus Lokiarchaeota archaeon]
MEKLTNKEFITPTVLIASVYAVLVSNFFMMAYRSVLDANWSFFTNNNSLANILALAFVLFIVILVLSIKYTEKIDSKILITIIIIITGLCGFVVTTFWTLEWFMLGFIVVALSIAYLTPCLSKLSTEMVGPEPEKDYYKLIFPISMILWIGISVLIFYFIENEYVWRFFYIISGVLNIAGSFMIYNV